jgi:hypothetical protein
MRLKKSRHGWSYHNGKGFDVRDCPSLLTLVKMYLEWRTRRLS